MKPFFTKCISRRREMAYPHGSICAYHWGNEMRLAAYCHADGADLKRLAPFVEVFYDYSRLEPICNSVYKFS